jgi:uncharacterized protein YbaA (DUF1428 family)
VARYVDGFVIPVRKRNVEAYRRMAQRAGKGWLELGALEFRECVGDDLEIKEVAPSLAVRREADGVWGIQGAG